MANLQPRDFPPIQFGIDWRVFAFTLGVTLACAGLFALVPMFRVGSLNLSADLHGATRGGSAGIERRRSVGLLLALQVSLAMMLVTGAGLMLRTLVELRCVDSGVDPSGVLTFSIRPSTGSYPTDRDRAAFIVRLSERLREVSGVEEVGAVRQLAMQGGGWTSDFNIEGWESERFGMELRHREATPGYFRAMNIPLLAGRLFAERLGDNDPVPVVVNRAFVDEYFPDESPVGRRIVFDRTPNEESYWYDIVGVVGNERHHVTKSTEPEVIAHIRGDTPGAPRFALKVTGDPTAIVPSIEAALTELDPDIPLVDVQTMNEVLVAATARERFLVNLLGVFGALALALASVGVYGVAAEAGRARMKEIGIRLALGATDTMIVRALIRRTGFTLGVGLLLGLVGSIAGTRLMEGLLYEVKPNDPLTLTVVAVLLSIMVLVASYLPARRAARVDPVTVLREE